MALFRDRVEAGRRLAERLRHYAGREDAIVLGLPRGGVPVAYQVAQALGLPLDAFLVRKLGVPGREELAFGAIASGGVRVINPDVVQLMGLDEATMDRITDREEAELSRRERAYRGDREPLEVAGRTVILVDDGLATGASMRAAVSALRRLRPDRIVIAAPTGAGESCDELRGEVDEVVCATTPYPFFGVGGSYDRFDQTTDEEVRDWLRRAREGRGANPEKRLREVAALAARIGYAIIATADPSGAPHLAAARRVLEWGRGRLALEEWFCPQTVENAGRNPSASILVWDPAANEGFQVPGRIESIQDLSMLDGYLPEQEGKGALPQVELRLVFKAGAVLPFRAGPHVDQPVAAASRARPHGSG